MNDPLSDRLQAWTCRPDFDPAFAAGVNARLAASPAGDAAPLFFTPAFRLAAAVCVLVAVGAGVGGGLALNQARANDRFAADYARSIDPLQMASAHGAHVHR